MLTVYSTTKAVISLIVAHHETIPTIKMTAKKLLVPRFRRRKMTRPRVRWTHC